MSSLIYYFGQILKLLSHTERKADVFSSTYFPVLNVNLFKIESEYLKGICILIEVDKKCGHDHVVLFNIYYYVEMELIIFLSRFNLHRALEAVGNFEFKFDGERF